VIQPLFRGPAKNSNRPIHRKYFTHREKDVPKNLTITYIRKSVSTAARAQKNCYTKKIATTVVHSEKTAGTHYDIFEQEKSSAKGAEQIQSLFRPSGQGKDTPTATERTPPRRKVWQKEEEIVLDEINKNTPVKYISGLNTSPRQIYDKTRRMRQSFSVCIYKNIFYTRFFIKNRRRCKTHVT